MNRIMNCYLKSCLFKLMLFLAMIVLGYANTESRSGLRPGPIVYVCAVANSFIGITIIQQQ